MSATPPSGGPPPAPRVDGEVDPRPWPPLAHPHNAGDPDKAFQPGFTMADAFIVLVLGIVAELAVGIAAASGGLDIAGSGRALVVVILASQAAKLAVLFWWLRRRGRPLWPLLGPIRPQWRHVPIGVALGVVGVLVVFVVSAMVASLVPGAAPPSQALVEEFGSDPVTIVGIIIASVVFAPVQEELTYRSLLFQSTRARIGLPGGLVLSALVFAAAHVEVWNAPTAMVSLTVLALWFAAIFHQTGTLVVPVVAHATFNAIMLGASQLVPQDVPSV